MNPPDDLLDRLKTAIVTTELTMQHGFSSYYSFENERWQIDWPIGWPTDALLLVEQPSVDSRKHPLARDAMLEHLGCSELNWENFVDGFDGMRVVSKDRWYDLGAELHQWVVSQGLCGEHNARRESSHDAS